MRNQLTFYLKIVEILFVLSTWGDQVLMAKGKGKHQSSLWYGIRQIDQPPTQQGNKLDFIDYFHNKSHLGQYQSKYDYLGLSLVSKWSPKWESDIRMTVNSGWSPASFYLRGSFFPIKSIGFSLTWYSCYQLIDDYSQYFPSTNPELTAYSYTNVLAQWRIYDRNVSAGLIVPLDWRFIHLRLGVNAGIGFISSFDNSVLIKEVRSNYKALKNFVFQPSPFFVLEPEAQLNIDCFTLKNKTIGIQFASTWMSTTRSVSYTETTSEWTNEAKVSETVKGTRHHFTRFEFNGGLYVRW